MPTYKRQIIKWLNRRVGTRFRPLHPWTTLRRWSEILSLRLWFTTVSTLAIGMGLLAVFVIYAPDIFQQQTLVKHVQMHMTEAISGRLIFDETGRPEAIRLPDELAWISNKLPTELRYRVTDDRSKVLLASRSTNEVWGDGAPGTLEPVTIDRVPFYVATVRIVHMNRVFFVQTATSFSLSSMLFKQKIAPLPRILKIVFFVVTLVLGVTLAISFRAVLRPLREASSAAASITPNNLTTRLSSVGLPREIRPLIDTFNGVLERLENGFKVQQQFLASVTHELQTPLTLVRGQIELHPDIDGKDTLLREIDLIGRQVRQLLHLTEVSEAQNFSFAEVNSVEVTRDVLAYMTRKSDGLRVSLMLEADSAPLLIVADRGALFILLKNLIENAINVSPPNSIVKVAVEKSSIQIHDEGPGVAQSDIPFLFKRFWRANNTSYDGAGLGLSICWEIATAHGWQILVDQQVCGLTMTVRFQHQS